MQSPAISATCSKQMYPILYNLSSHDRASLREPIVYYFSILYINSQIEQIYEPEIIYNVSYVIFFFSVLDTFRKNKTSMLV